MDWEVHMNEVSGSVGIYYTVALFGLTA